MTGREPRVGRSGARRPWGYKLTIHVYGSGPMPGRESMFEAAREAAEIVGADDFVGVDARVVRSRPKEQVGS